MPKYENIVPYNLSANKGKPRRVLSYNKQGLTSGMLQRFIEALTLRVDGVDCWQWTGKVNNLGYPTFQTRTRYIGTVNVAAYWYKHFNQIPAKHSVRNTCGNKLCVNPKHHSLHEQTEHQVACGKPLTPKQPISGDNIIRSTRR